MRLSYTKLNYYRSCPKKYEFRYVQRLPEPESPEMATGTMGHSILESYYTTPDRNQDTLSSLIAKKLDTDEERERFLQIFDGYHEWAWKHDKDLTDIKTEVSLERKYNRGYFTYEGKVDVLATRGQYRVALEHKFKRQWANNYILNLYYDEQSKSYAYLADVDMVEFNLVRTVSASTRPKFERVQLIIPSDEKQRLIEDVNKWRGAIVLDETTKSFPRNRGYGCQWCSFKDKCFDYGEANEQPHS